MTSELLGETNNLSSCTRPVLTFEYPAQRYVPETKEKIILASFLFSVPSKCRQAQVGCCVDSTQQNCTETRLMVDLP
jgi:hypothetical protein